jgi:hypothetical protein
VVQVEVVRAVLRQPTQAVRRQRADVRARPALAGLVLDAQRASTSAICFVALREPSGEGEPVLKA